MKNSKQGAYGTYMWLVIVAGALSCIYAGLNLPLKRIDIYFLILTVGTIFIGSRVAIRIPQININITVDDTFIFIGLLMYGREAAVLLGAIAGVFSGLRISKKFRTVAFGGAALACAVRVTATVLRQIFGPATELFNQDVSLALIGLSSVSYTHLTLPTICSV